MFKRLKNALLGSRPATAKERPTPPPAAIERDQLLRTIEQIQDEQAGLATFSQIEEEDLTRFTPRLQQLLQRPDLEQALQEPEREPLAFINALFDFIAQDQNIPPQLRPLLTILHAPYAKLALLEPRFFSDSGHPAWRLLNNLAILVIGWSPEFENAEHSVQRRIELLVNRILTDFQRDPTIFRVIDLEFAEYVNREIAAGLANQERTLRTSRGNEVLQQVQAQVTQEIDEPLARNPLTPKVVEVLLRSAWRNVLLVNGLRHGLDSAQFQRAKRAAQTLLWSVTPDTVQHHRTTLLQIIPKLVTELQRGLEMINYDPQKSQRLLKKLQQCHLAALRGQDIWSATGENTEAILENTAIVSEAAQRARETPPPKALTITNNFLWIAQSLPPGSWVELIEEERTKKRIKLAWKSELNGTILFVDRQGDQALEVSYEELARMMAEGQALLLSDTEKPFRERAIHFVVKQLQKEQGEGEGEAEV